MNKKLISLFALLSVALLAAIFNFAGIDGFAASWRAFSNGSTWIPFNPYGNRVEDSSNLRRFEATHVVFEDQSLFWKGTGASAIPKLNGNGELEQLIMDSHGWGYGSVVVAKIVGAGANQFKLGEVKVRDGRIVAVDILKTAKWYDSTRMFYDGERLPFSGIAQIKYRNGQLMESRPYLEGELHGKWLKWKENGIPLFAKDYVRGLRHGTHMHWYGKPVDPKEFVPNPDGYASLWTEVNDLAKQKFEGEYPSLESNEWVVETYKDKGGSWGRKSLENYDNNRLHGLNEGYAVTGEAIFKDEYQTGKRIKHKSFDPGNKWKVPKRLSGWAD